MAKKKYLTYDGLTEYDELIKGEIADGDSATLASAKSYADGLVTGGHNHDDRYYTETEVTNLLKNYSPITVFTTEEPIDGATSSYPDNTLICVYEEVTA